MTLHSIPLVLCVALATAGCARLDALRIFDNPAQTPDTAQESANTGAQGATRARDRPGAQEGAADTTDADAVRFLGRSVATLGDPSRPGLWVETPLADSGARGRVVLTDGGQGVDLDLIPADDDGGSRLSPAAMRALGLPLGALAEIEVFGP